MTNNLREEKVSTPYRRSSNPMNFTRRQILKTSGTVLASAGLGLRTLSAAAHKRPGMKKALMFGMVKTEGTLLDKFRMLKEVGYDGVELDSPGFDVKEALKARDETGLQICGVVDSVHWKQTLSDPDPAVRAAGLEGLKTALRECKQYGGNSVLLVPAVVNKQVSYADAYVRSQAEIRKALPLAEELKVKIAVENELEPVSAQSTGGSTLCGRVQESLGGLAPGHWQPHHLWLAGALDQGSWKADRQAAHQGIQP
jgi:sugar phosphate isomerase/epimerase